MVMYRPQKSPKIPLGAAELPPSYDSLFAEENPPNYSRIIENVNLPAITEDEAISTVENASNGATSSLDSTTQPIIVRNENQISINGILSREDNPSISRSNTNNGFLWGGFKFNARYPLVNVALDQCALFVKHPADNFAASA